MVDILLEVRVPGPGETFDPTPLIGILGRPSQYESAVLVSMEELEKPIQVPPSWGDGFGYPETHILATPWVLKGDTLKRMGESYPLLKSEFVKRVPTEHVGPNGEQLFRKPGLTHFWHVPEDLDGKILVYSPESSSPQIAKVGKMIAYTDTGAWVATWNPDKYSEVIEAS